MKKWTWNCFGCGCALIASLTHVLRQNMINSTTIVFRLSAIRAEKRVEENVAVLYKCYMNMMVFIRWNICQCRVKIWKKKWWDIRLKRLWCTSDMLSLASRLLHPLTLSSCGFFFYLNSSLFNFLLNFHEAYLNWFCLLHNRSRAQLRHSNRDSVFFLSFVRCVQCCCAE